MSMVDNNEIFQDGWRNIKENAIAKLINFLNTGNSTVMFTKKEYMEYYTLVYNMSVLKQENIQNMLYDGYTESINTYLEENVLPELKTHSQESLLECLKQKWLNHEIMVKWM